MCVLLCVCCFFPFWLKQSHFAHCFFSNPTSFFLLLHIHKTWCHTTQSVVEGRCPVWLGPDLTWTSPKSEWSRMTVPPHQSPVSQRPPVSVRQPIAIQKKKGQPRRRSRCRTHQNSEIGEGTRGHGGRSGPSCRCVEVGVGQGEASREGSTTVSPDCSDTGFHQTLGETIDGSGGGTQSRSRVLAGREGEAGPGVGLQSRVRSRRRQCPICASADMGQGDGRVERRRAGCGSPATACKRQAAMRSTTSGDIPLMPVHMPKDLDNWIRDRNLDLQEALSWRWPACVRVDLEVVRGVAQMSTLTGVMWS